MQPRRCRRARQSKLMQLARSRPLLIALLLGAVAATGFAPLGLWPLSLICVAGLMALLDVRPSGKTWRPQDAGAPPASRDAGPGGWRAFLIGWSFGVGHFTVGLNWIAHAFTYQDAMPHWLGYIAVVALSLYLAVFPGLATLATVAIRARGSGAPLIPLFAGLWVLSEYARASLFTGFAWNPLGVMWLGTGVDQAARLIGTYGLSAVAITAGGGLLALARRRWHVGAPILGVLIAIAILGHVEPRRAASATGIAITVVQPNIDQNEKYGREFEERNFARLARLTGLSSPDRPRLVFWPEAALEAWLDFEPEWRARVAGLLGPNDLLVTGGVKPFIENRPRGRFLTGATNSTWVVTPDARLVARYDKAHLVPYGEYLPMRSILEPIGLSRLVPGDADFIPGPGPRSLALSGADGRSALRMGVQICYEIIFSGHVIDAGDRPAFLFNPSNDAWFGSWGPPQHLAQARMRAIEEAMPVIRSTPTGISAVIDGHGRLTAFIPHRRAGAINSTLPEALPATPFARFGNLLPICVALVLVLTSILLARRHGRR